MQTIISNPADPQCKLAMAEVPTLIDITLPIHSEMLLYPGDRPPSIRRLSSISHGESLTTSEITIGCHVGSHIDAPAHFLNGREMVDQLEARHFCGPSQVLDVRNCSRISKKVVASLQIQAERHILFKTDNSPKLYSAVFN